MTQTSSRTVTGAVTETLHGGRTVTITAAGDTRNVQGDVTDTNVGLRSTGVEGAMEQSATQTFTAFSTGEMKQVTDALIVAFADEKVRPALWLDLGIPGRDYL